jgi:hypothetical protein
LTDTNLKDTDGDTLPDGWEAAYGLCPTNPLDAEGDLDGDGVRNRDEFDDLTRLDGTVLEKGWHAVSVWRAGSYQWGPPVRCAYTWDATAQQFVPFRTGGLVEAGDGILFLLERRTTSSSNMDGGGSIGSSGTWTGDVIFDRIRYWVIGGLAFGIRTDVFPVDTGTVSVGHSQVSAFATDAFPLTATPRRGYRFHAWSADGNVALQSATDAHTSFRLWGDGNVTANFRLHEGLADRDGDRMLDTWEIEYALDPFDAEDADNDLDHDGLTNREEFIHGCNPRCGDCDGDGLSDGVETAAELNPHDPDDALLDADGDGLDNQTEAKVRRPINGKQLVPGWNLFSVGKPCRLKLPSAVADQAYSLRTDLPGHVCLENGQTLNPARAYWLYLSEPAEIDTLTGQLSSWPKERRIRKLRRQH